MIVGIVPIWVVPAIVTRRIPRVVMPMVVPTAVPRRRIPIETPSRAAYTPSPMIPIRVPITRRNIVVIVVWRVTPTIVIRGENIDVVVVKHIDTTSVLAVGNNYHIVIVGV
jgi:hypothetical protein